MAKGRRMERGRSGPHGSVTWMIAVFMRRGVAARPSPVLRPARDRRRVDSILPRVPFCLVLGDHPVRGGASWLILDGLFAASSTPLLQNIALPPDVLREWVRAADG